jgi:DNA-binding Lrp family transcriptional regulator
MPAPGYRIGKNNLDEVRRYFETHLCATQTECAEYLGLSPMAVNRHVKKIRAEWQAKEDWDGNGN